MPQYGLDASTDLHRIDSVLAQPPRLELDALEDLPGIAAPAGFDFLGDVSKMTAAVQRNAGGVAGLKLAELDLSVAKLAVAAPKSDTITELFTRGCKLLESGDARGAGPLFEQVLAQQPAHHEARYLRALCFAKRDEHKQALKTLAPLAAVRLDGQLATRVAMLRDRLRGPLLLATLLATQRRKPDQLLAELEELIALDPECAQYHFLLAGFLLMSERIREAHAAARRGLEAASEAEMIEAMRMLYREITRRLIRQALAPVFAFYKTRRYRAARKELRRLSPDVRDSPVAVVLDGYLKELETGWFAPKRTPVQVPLDGDPKVLDDLHFGLIADELAQAKSAAERGDGPAAQRALMQALEHAPWFPFLRFQLAANLYQEAIAHLRVGMDIDAAAGRLGAAKTHVQFAVRDGELTEAPRLLAAIERLQGECRDMESVGTVIADYARIMATANDGIGSFTQYQQIAAGLQKLDSGIRVASENVKGGAAKQALGQLKETVGKNLEQLRAMEPKVREAEARRRLVERVNELGGRFEAIMNSASDGVSSPGQVRVLHRKLTALTKDVAAARAETADPKAHEVLDQITKAAGRNLGQLQEAESAIAEMEALERLVKSFASTMSALSRKGVTRDVVRSSLSTLEDIQEEASRLQNSATSSSVRSQAAQLESTVKGILDRVQN